jgi:hypothetical protein
VPAKPRLVNEQTLQRVAIGAVFTDQAVLGHEPDIAGASHLVGGRLSNLLFIVRDGIVDVRQKQAQFVVAEPKLTDVDVCVSTGDAVLGSRWPENASVGHGAHAWSLVAQGGNPCQASQLPGWPGLNLPTRGGIAAGLYPTPGKPNITGGTRATYMPLKHQVRGLGHVHLAGLHERRRIADTPSPKDVFRGLLYSKKLRVISTVCSQSR